MDCDALTAMLDDGLLTGEEIATTREWHKLFPDPPPEWKMGIMGDE